MHITATQIADWAKTTEARSGLPKLVRRLIHELGTPEQISFPAGDSVNSPGWDGEVVNDQTSPWVPRGASFWELSCETNVTTKANSDYKKRTDETSHDIRSKASLVVVTTRKWSRKKKWVKSKRDLGIWRDVRAYDADDLEQWLEQAPAVALQFGEEIGLIGPGVESISRYWINWSQQSNPSISFEALFTDRYVARDQFLKEIRQRLQDKSNGPYIIKADSVEEATAFVCAALLAQPDLDPVSLVVSSEDGWRFVEQNNRIKIALAARPEITKKPTQREGLILVIPYAAGDMSGYYPGTAGRGDHISLTLKRADIYEFEKALISIGLDEAEAKRLGATTGRSWSVFRRRRATNPAIRKPVWLDSPQASTLSTLCLISGWSGDKSSDRDIVATISGRSYEELERDLRQLARFDDAPVIRIGEIWKAKSPLELLDLFGERITRAEIDRFFDAAQHILALADPILELPEEKRHAAQIYGKVRSESPLLIETLCDALIKLSVWGSHMSGLSAMDIDRRVAYLELIRK